MILNCGLAYGCLGCIFSNLGQTIFKIIPLDQTIIFPLTVNEWSENTSVDSSMMENVFLFIHKSFGDSCQFAIKIEPSNIEAIGMHYEQRHEIVVRHSRCSQNALLWASSSMSMSTGKASTFHFSVEMSQKNAE